MLINEGDLQKLVEPGMNTHFMKAAAAVPQAWREVADFIKSNKGSETMPWLGGLPDPSEFTDERKRRQIREFDWTIVNKPFELTVGVKRTAIEDEQYGQLNNLASKMGAQFGRFFNKSVYEMIANAATLLCYDGQYLVDTDHQEGDSGQQSNKGSSALDATSYAVARAAMMTFKDDQGNIVGRVGNRLVVPAGLEATAKKIVRLTTTDQGGENVFGGTAEVIVNPFQSDANDWFLIDGTEGNRPIILQERTPLEVGFHKYWNRNEIDYGAYWRGGFGVADWRSIYGSIVANN